MRNVITLKNLKKSFSDREILKGIDLEISEGEVVCLIGPSGSGKSTFLRCLNRLEEATSGDIEVDGLDVRLNIVVVIDESLNIFGVDVQNAVSYGAFTRKLNIVDLNDTKF